MTKAIIVPRNLMLASYFKFVRSEITYAEYLRRTSGEQMTNAEQEQINAAASAAMGFGS